MGKILISLRRALSLTVLLFLFSHFTLWADEGMWLISLIGRNVETMQRMGLKLSAEDIYSINKSSIKDAVVSLDDGGCTGEIISSKGLILTNHHCGVGDVQYHSTEERNYIRDGFWASSLQDELYIPGKTALILLRVEDVTERILSEVDTLQNSNDFSDLVNSAILKLQLETEMKEKGTHVKVVPMFNHNQYYLFVYHRYTDVRLVGVPPASIGNFGGDVDNWQWPRHTGDFCMFRIYAGPDGLPANFSKNNVPFQPKHHFPISLNGVENGDFTMIVGYPGTTFRLSTSFQAEHARDVVAPWIDDVWGNLIQTLKEEMKSNPTIKVRFTDTHDLLVNFWQKDTYQAKSMFAYGVVERLKEREDSLVSWAKRSAQNPQEYLDALPGVQSYYTFVQERNYEELFRALNALLSYPVDVGNNFNEAIDLFSALTSNKANSRAVKKECKKLRKKIPEIFENYYPELDAQLYSHALLSVIENLPDTVSDPLLKKLKSVEGLDLIMPIIVNNFFQKSYFTSPERFEKLLKKPNVDSLLSDPLFFLHITFENMVSRIQGELIPYNHVYLNSMRLFSKGILEMEKDKLHYPDANSTMRVSYGKIVGYKPRDGVNYKPFTYLDGIMEKEDPTSEVFIVPAKLKQLWAEKDFGSYGTEKGVPVCFITDNDITNGNSGSPVLNDQGQLIGVAFDGNFEAMSSDFAYEPQYQRTIIADIRYVLFVVDKFAGAKHLVDEMTIIE